MITQLAKSTVFFLIGQKIIGEEDFAVYKYGMELVIWDCNKKRANRE